MTESLSLHGLRMNAAFTAPNGVINAETIFEFEQHDNRVWATYAGGKVEHGYLVGLITADGFEFRYCQQQPDGTLDGGHSRCELRRNEEGLVEIVEHFEWGSRPGGGTNIIREVR